MRKIKASHRVKVPDEEIFILAKHYTISDIAAKFGVTPEAMRMRVRRIQRERGQVKEIIEEQLPQSFKTKDLYNAQITLLLTEQNKLIDPKMKKDISDAIGRLTKQKADIENSGFFLKEGAIIEVCKILEEILKNIDKSAAEKFAARVQENNDLYFLLTGEKRKKEKEPKDTMKSRGDIVFEKSV